MYVDKSESGRIVIDGMQTVRNIQVTLDRLSAAIAKHQVVEVHCDQIAELDLSFIQLLLAAMRSADKQGKSLKLAAPAAGKLRTALDRAGFLAVGVDESHSTAAFWLKGSNAV